MRTHHLLILAALTLLCACAGPAARLQGSDIGYRFSNAEIPVSKYRDTRWHAVVIAAGNEAGVFERFANDFSKTLKQSPDVADVQTLLSAKPMRDTPRYANLRNINETLSALKPAEGEGCLIYMTGHGSPDGVALSAMRGRPALPPALVEVMLGSCKARPTIVVISACYSGVFMRDGIAARERIVFTAADADHPSFGCSDDTRYTYFDGCFLDSWGQAKTWQALGEAINTCVTAKERLLDMHASSPQFFYGRDMRDLPLPAPRN